MDFFDVVKVRRSTRAFAPTPIEPEKIQRILAAANAAPSAGNLQAYEIYAVSSAERLKRLAIAAGNQDFIAQAQIALIFCTNPPRSAQRYNQRGRTLYCLQDATIACAYAQLAVTALGLSSVWVGAYDDDAVQKAIGVDKDQLPVAILPIGYAAEKPEMTKRRSIHDLVHQVTVS